MDFHPGPTLAQIIKSREQAAAQGDEGAAPHVPSAPQVPSRSHSWRGGSRDQIWEKPPSPIRKIFNMIFGMCKSTHDVMHKERQRRKKDTLRLKKIQETMLPNDPPSPVGSEGQQSEPENLEQMSARYQQEDYWGQLYGSNAYPSQVDPSAAWFAPPPPSSAPPTYGLNDLSSWMFGQHLGDPGQGSSGQGGRNNDGDDAQE